MKFTDYSIQDLEKESIGFEGDVLVKSSIPSKTLKGLNYLKLIISDGDLDISATIWDYNASVKGDLPSGVVYHVIGNMKLYNGLRTINIDELTSTDIDPMEFAYEGGFTVDDYLARLTDITNLMKDSSFKDTIGEIITDNFKDYITVPAAVGHHHNHYRGNLKHSLEVAFTAYQIGEVFKAFGYDVNSDLLIAGGLIHDLGKCKCYAITNGVPSMTDCGKLHDHIIEGCLILRDYKDKLGKYYSLLDAIIASHHENLEWGSPVKPAFIEALIVARADNLSFSINSMSNALKSQDTRWSKSKDFIAGTYLLNYNKGEE